MRANSRRRSLARSRRRLPKAIPTRRGRFYKHFADFPTITLLRGKGLRASVVWRALARSWLASRRVQLITKLLPMEGKKMSGTAPSWSFTASTQSHPDDDALVVCCLSPSLLGIEALVGEVAELCGEEEGRRWHRARAEEYGTRLLDMLRLHLPSAELIVHLEEDDVLEKVRVVVSGDDADPARREAELMDRVSAIRERTWLAWWEGLQLTMAQLRGLDANGSYAAYRETGGRHPLSAKPSSRPRMGLRA